MDLMCSVGRVASSRKTREWLVVGEDMEMPTFEEVATMLDGQIGRQQFTAECAVTALGL